MLSATGSNWPSASRGNSRRAISTPAIVSSAMPPTPSATISAVENEFRIDRATCGRSHRRRGRPTTRQGQVCPNGCPFWVAYDPSPFRLRRAAGFRFPMADENREQERLVCLVHPELAVQQVVEDAPEGSRPQTKGGRGEDEILGDARSAHALRVVPLRSTNGWRSPSCFCPDASVGSTAIRAVVVWRVGGRRGGGRARRASVLRSRPGRGLGAFLVRGARRRSRLLAGC